MGSRPHQFGLTNSILGRAFRRIDGYAAYASQNRQNAYRRGPIAA